MLKSRPQDELIQKQLNAGEVVALEYLFHHYYDDLCRYTMVFTKDIAIAENIIQDLFVYIWEHRETIEIHISFESYLFQASRYKALNYKRDNSNKIDKLTLLKEKYNGKVSVSAYEVFEYKELNQIVSNAIDLLPDRCRQIFKLSRTDELSYREIAELMNISISTIDNQVHTAIKKIKTHVKRYYPEMYLSLLIFINLIA